MNTSFNDDDDVVVDYSLLALCFILIHFLD